MPDYIPVAAALMHGRGVAADLSTTPPWRWWKRTQLRAELRASCAIADATRRSVTPGSVDLLPLREIIRQQNGI